MPSPKAAPAVRITLLDLHVRIAISDCFGLTILAGADNKLLPLTWGAPWAVTW
jgi:hypothetical protein